MQAESLKDKRKRLLEQAKEASSAPGVYLMKDHEGVILYVGKAKSLKNRVTSYFQASRHDAGRIEMLVARIHHFDVILTETEIEALILEATLIKKHKPKYNVRLKDDKAYPFIKVQFNEDYPRLQWTRKVQRDGARYYGPFPSAWSARQVLKLLTETFKLRDCSDNTFSHRSRPCILYEMQKCSGPCVKKISVQAYRESIEEAAAVLQGKGDSLIHTLTRGMEDASERMDYEHAAEYRDQIQNLKLITETQGAVQAGKDVSMDVLGIAREAAEAHGAILQIRRGKMIGVKHYRLQNAEADLSAAEVLREFLTQYYVPSAHTEGAPSRSASQENWEGEDSRFITQAPTEVLLPEAPAQILPEVGENPAILEKVFGVTLRVAENKEEEQLLNVARANAEHALELSNKKEGGHGRVALEDIQKRLQLENLPQRVECYDISNIQGQDAVASRVVFLDGAPDKSLYRRYKIKTVEGANDFAMMKEVLGRRFQREDDEFPDLLVVDGGKGQLAQAVAILEELNVQGVEVCGLAKARTESDFKAKEVKSSMERVFIPGRKNFVNLLPHTLAYKMLVHIRDEAHRFAVTYHRSLRSKRSLKSES